MIKKLLLALMIILLPISTAKAYLMFSYPSVAVVCNSLEGILSVFEIAQNRKPVAVVIGCYGDSSFGGPVASSARSYLKQISATVPDWEGDPFAVFEVLGQDVWLIIYNPDELNNSVKNN